MNSNNFFCFSRFYLLLRNDILLNYKKYLFIIAAAFILGFIILYSSMPDLVVKGDLKYVFDATPYSSVFGMCLLGLLAFVGSAFSELSTKVKTSNYLLLPASTFEKFLSQFVIYVLAGTAIFLIVFWIDAHLARYIALSNLKEAYNEDLGAEREKHIEAFNYSMLLTKNRFPGVIYKHWFEELSRVFAIFSVGMYFLSVKVFFKSFGLIKTAISFIAVALLGTLLMMLLSHIFYPDTNGFELSHHINYKLTNGFSNMDIWVYVSVYCVSLFIIPFGYFKLKEKQL